MDPRPYSSTLGIVNLQDYMEYSRDVLRLSNEAHYQDLVILHNVFEKSTRTRPPTVYPLGDVLYRNDVINIQSREPDVDIYYTVNSATVPTSFTGQKFSSSNPIPFMSDYGINTFELMCVAIAKGKLDSIVVSKLYKEVCRDKDRPAHLMKDVVQ